ncbi:OsmC family protein [bacterium]|nr:OsmC family protein [bacterium]
MSKFNVMFPGGKRVDVGVGDFTINTDQSKLGGGEGSAPEPFTLFLASIASCAGIYAKVFCDQRQIDTADMTLGMDIVYDTSRQMVGKVVISLRVPADFPDKYDDAVIRAMNTCAVKRHLHPDVVVESMVVR